MRELKPNLKLRTKRSVPTRGEQHSATQQNNVRNCASRKAVRSLRVTILLLSAPRRLHASADKPALSRGSLENASVDRFCVCFYVLFFCLHFFAEFCAKFAEYKIGRRSRTKNRSKSNCFKKRVRKPTIHEFRLGNAFVDRFLIWVDLCVFVLICSRISTQKSLSTKPARERNMGGIVVHDRVELRKCFRYSICFFIE